MKLGRLLLRAATHSNTALIPEVRILRTINTPT
jgi:hypothetical protein